MVKTERECRGDIIQTGRLVFQKGVGCPLPAEVVAAGARECGAGEERFLVTRAELVAMVDEAVGTRGA